jgi:hypothetical protein
MLAALVAVAVRARPSGVGAGMGVGAGVGAGAGAAGGAERDRVDSNPLARSDGPGPSIRPNDGPAAVPATVAASPTPAAPKADESTEAIARQLKADLAGTIESILPSDKPMIKPGGAAGSETAAKVAGPTIELATSDAHPVAGLVKARAVRREDGAMILDDQFIVRGAGTREDPYVVDFALLLSAENTYQPRKGLKRLPQRVAFLHGAWVRLTGYVAFPLTAADPKEMLAMLNQWDGCCIGVPPTPYDAVEVQLATAVSGNARLSVHGTVTGRFEVDPFIDANYLLGLYVMKDATFSSDKIDENLQRQHTAP